MEERVKLLNRYVTGWGNYFGLVMSRTSTALKRRKRRARSTASSSCSRPQLSSRVTMSASSAARREVPAAVAALRKASATGPRAMKALSAGLDANRTQRSPGADLVMLVLDRDLARRHQRVTLDLAAVEGDDDLVVDGVGHHQVGNDAVLETAHAVAEDHRRHRSQLLEALDQQGQRGS